MNGSLDEASLVPPYFYPGRPLQASLSSKQRFVSSALGLLKLARVGCINGRHPRPSADPPTAFLAASDWGRWESSFGGSKCEIVAVIQQGHNQGVRVVWPVQGWTHLSQQTWRVGAQLMLAASLHPPSPPLRPRGT